MSPVVRFFRIALPILFVLFVVIIVISFSGRSGREPRQQAKPPADLPAGTGGDKPRTVADQFEDTQTIAGRIVLRVRAKRVVATVSGWNKLEDVHLTIFRPNGQSYDLSAAQAQVNAETKEAEASGGVKVASSDGIELQTASIRYDGKRIANKIPVQFRVDQWSGRAGSLNLDVSNEMLTLGDGIEADLKPTRPAELPMHLTAGHGTFERTTGKITFASHVVTTRQGDVIRADQVQVRLAAGMKNIDALEGSGAVLVELAAGSAALGQTATGGTRIKAERFFSENGPSGSVDAIDVEGGSAPVVATMSGPPQRTLSSRKLRILLNGRVIREMQAETDVVLIEEATPLRKATSRAANVYFDPASRKAINLYLQDAITYDDGKVQAAGDRANYEFATRKLVLSALPTKAPTVKTDSETLRATVIEVLAAEQTLKATGSVFVEMKQKAGAVSGGGAAIFPDRDPIYVNCDTAFLVRSNKSAQFSGNVRAWQGANTVFSRQLQVSAETEVLTATGEVRGSFTNAVKSGGTAPVLTRSDSLTGRKRERRIDLEGKVRIDDNGRVMESEKATAFLDARQKIDHIEASGKLNISERASGRKGSGEHALYKLAQKTILIDGNPATMADPKGSIRGSQIVFDVARNKVDVISGASPTEATYNPQ